MPCAVDQKVATGQAESGAKTSPTPWLTPRLGCHFLRNAVEMLGLKGAFTNAYLAWLVSKKVYKSRELSVAENRKGSGHS